MTSITVLRQRQNAILGTIVKTGGTCDDFNSLADISLVIEDRIKPNLMRERIKKPHHLSVRRSLR